MCSKVQCNVVWGSSVQVSNNVVRISTVECNMTLSSGDPLTVCQGSVTGGQVM